MVNVGKIDSIQDQVDISIEQEQGNTGYGGASSSRDPAPSAAPSPILLSSRPDGARNSRHHFDDSDEAEMWEKEPDPDSDDYSMHLG